MPKCLPVPLFHAVHVSPEADTTQPQWSPVYIWAPITNPQTHVAQQGHFMRWYRAWLMSLFSLGSILQGVALHSVGKLSFKDEWKPSSKSLLFCPLTITCVHEYMSQDDVGNWRSVFPSPPCSFFSFFFLWQLVFKLARLGHWTHLFDCAWSSSGFPGADYSFCELNAKHAPAAPSAIPPGVSFSQTKQIPAIPGHRPGAQEIRRKLKEEWKYTALDCNFF